ncbi:MAG TPA: phospholipid carrier-dependent glycosyltransferase [Phycisphaerae bacterium]|nr:phospholipid carrier-dependent glycosyltransferase [Phycisphaerae bacterium]
MQKRLRWMTYLVLGVGVAFRVGLALVTPPDRAYDDHYEPVEVILTKGRIPDAVDCWEGFQPPLYYLVSAGFCTVTQRFAPPGDDEAVEYIGRRTLQFVSVAAGCATLWVCLLILRRFDELAGHQALALSLVAFLPRHIYMSAMATNDAFTYLVASLAVYAALRAQAAGWRTRWCIVTGLLAGATVLSKGYGWVTVAVIVLVVWLFTRRRAAPGEPRLRCELSRPLAFVLVSALALAVWPTARNLWVFGELHVDNYQFRDTPMYHQPPGSLADTSFRSFRLPALLQHPWLHVAHVDSVWTELYGRLWFDYEGFNTTLAPYPPWQRLWERCAQAYPEWNRARWLMLLDPAPDEVPPDFKRVAILSYFAGLPLTLAVLAGLLLAVRRARQSFGVALVSLHFVFAVLVPVFQTLRLPHFAAMKAAFALSGLAGAPVLLALVLNAIHSRAVRLTVVGALWLLAAAVAFADAAFVLLQTWHAYRTAGGA